MGKKQDEPDGKKPRGGSPSAPAALGRADYERHLDALALELNVLAPVFEQLPVDDRILLLKYWLTVDQVQQEGRFAERAADPMKRWKLSPIDPTSRTRYAEYTAARTAMLAATPTRHAPWTLVEQFGRGPRPIPPYRTG